MRPVAVAVRGLAEAGGLAQALATRPARSAARSGVAAVRHHLQPPAGPLDRLDEGARPRLDPDLHVRQRGPGRRRSVVRAWAAVSASGKREGDAAGLLAVASVLAGNLDGAIGPRTRQGRPRLALPRPALAAGGFGGQVRGQAVAHHQLPRRRPAPARGGGRPGRRAPRAAVGEACQHRLRRAGPGRRRAGADRRARPGFRPSGAARPRPRASTGVTVSENSSAAAWEATMAKACTPKKARASPWR